MVSTSRNPTVHGAGGAPRQAQEPDFWRAQDDARRPACTTPPGRGAGRARPAESRARGPSSWPRGNSWARGHSPGKPLCSVSRVASNLTLVRVKIDAQARQF